MTAGATITITVNGTPREVELGTPLLDLVESLNLHRELIAVEVNRAIVSKADYPARKLEAGDQVEIVEFVGGG